VDHAAIARACGCAGVRIEAPEAFPAALDAALASGRPTVLDILVDPDAHPPITSFAGRFRSPF
jgi:acetolactate synthase-1/2/3 large subunit